MHFIKNLVPQSLKNLYHLLQAISANVIYGFPSRKLKVIGITGTDGKTTTTQMVAKILEEAGKKVAMASTINFRIAGDEEFNPTHYTTPSAFSVQKFTKRAVEAGCEYLVLETSSHSLDQYRVWGINYRVAVITNVTREHLDYHKTMENYRKAKARLFETVAKNKGVIVVNLDMEDPVEFLNFDVDEKYGYSTRMQNANLKMQNDNAKCKSIHAEDIVLGIDNSKFKIQNSKFSIHLPGLFNIENALAAVGVGLSQGISLENCAKGLERITGVPGRMESIPNGRGLDIVVDFALTPESLGKLYGFLASVKKTPQSEIIAAFGSCGERDRGKRPLMAKVVAGYADRIILTNDEPYHEDPRQIIAEIADGIEDKKEGEDYWRIPDRREAIAKALGMAKTGDMVVVTGMGNLESMVVGNKKIPWNDRKVIEEELEKLGK